MQKFYNYKMKIKKFTSQNKVTVDEVVIEKPKRKRKEK